MGFGFKHFAEGLQMFEAQFIGDFTDGKLCCGEFFFGLFDQFVVDVLLGRLPCQSFQQTAQIGGRNI